MAIYDVLFSLELSGVIQRIRWENDSLKRLYADIWESYAGRNVRELFPAYPTDDLLSWQDENFQTALITGEKTDFLLLKRETNLVQLYQSALDKITEGIQVYDKNACVVYINKASRVISDIPEQIQVEGRHLLDLYDLNENISTVMTSLRTGAPVINRFDVFRSTEGSNITSTNSAFPVLHNGKLLGSIVFEQDASVVENQIGQLRKIQQVMAEKTEYIPTSRFSGYTFQDVIGSDERLTGAVTLARRVAPQDCNVLLVGETGTGKEIFAQSIHRASNRHSHKLVAINCAAIPDQLIEGLFFGTKKGSYTGSIDQPGYVEEANGGTLFLDELNSMSLSMQAKILRVIQEGVFRRVGGEREISTDLRIVASCNEDPFQLISQNRLRKDLFYRLSTVLIDLPPLREHPADIDELVTFYMAKRSDRYIKTIPRIGEDVMQVLRGYPWPGNVRELFHVLDHILNVIDGDTIDVKHLPRYIGEAQRIDNGQPETGVVPESLLRHDLQYVMDSYEERVLRAVLEHHGYNVTKTAAALGLRRQSLQYRIRKYNIVM